MTEQDDSAVVFGDSTSTISLDLFGNDDSAYGDLEFIGLVGNALVDDDGYVLLDDAREALEANGNPVLDADGNPVLGYATPPASMPSSRSRAAP